MNHKYLGIILIVLSMVSGISTYVIHSQEQQTLNKILEEQGTCFLDDGTCVHAKSNTSRFIYSIVPLAIFILGLYLLVFERAQNQLNKQHLKVSDALEKAKMHEREKDEFQAFLKAFTNDEKKILSVVKDQEGITQSTLRYKTGMSKTGLSLLLASLEERGIISRKIKGKTKQIFLKHV